MAVSVASVFWLTAVGAFWGCTNPFIKRSGKGLETVKGRNEAEVFVKEIVYLLTSLEYMVPYVINQFGSLIYFLTLQNVDMSLAVPISNSMTFVFTAITGWFLGEGRPNMKILFGMFLVLSGISLCVYDKAKHL